MDPDESGRSLRALRERVEHIASANAAGGEDTLLDAFQLVVDSEAARSPEDSDPRSYLERLPDVVADHLSVSTRSRVPGGSLVHRAVNAATRRQSEALLHEMQHLAHEVKSRLVELAAVDSAPMGEKMESLRLEFDALAWSLSELEKDLSTVSVRLESLEERVERLETVNADRGFRPWFSAQDFDDAFRGGRNVILDRYHDLADILADAGGPIVDLGCGRGELLELLQVRDVEAWGVEVVPELVEYCQSIHLDVRLGDARSALESVADGSLGGVALIQVVEHLTPQNLVELIPIVLRKLRAGGLAVAETVNARSLFAFVHSFYIDPTHTNPIHPDYLAFLFRKAGFGEVEIQYRSQVPDRDQLQAPGPDGLGSQTLAELAQIIERLNGVLYAPQDYAVLARR